MTDTPNGVTQPPQVPAQIINGTSLSLIANGALNAFGEVVSLGLQSWMATPRFQESVRKLVAPQPQAPQPQAPQVIPLKGCPWCSAAHHLAGIREYIDHINTSEWPDAFVYQAHQSTVELMERCRLTSTGMMVVYNDLVDLVEKLGAIRERTPRKTLPNAADMSLLGLVRVKLDEMITRCFRASEGGAYADPPAPVTHGPSEQIIPPRPANGPKRK